MSLTYDAQGFIVGIKKSLDEQLQNQKAIKNDTAQIVRLLQGEVVRQQRRLRQSKQSNFNNQNRPTHPKSRQPANGLQNGAMTEQQRATQNHRPTGQALRQSSQTGERLRDKNGRFVGQGGDNSPKGKKDKGELPTLVTSAGNTVLDIVAQKMIADTRNLDPFLDAVGEVQDFVNPITGKLGGLFGKKQKLPKEKERFYKKLHKKLAQLAERQHQGGQERGGFGLSKIGKSIALVLGTAMTVGLAGVFGAFGKKKTPEPPSTQKTQSIGNSQKSLSPITANVDTTLNKAAKQEFGTLTRNLSRQELPKKLLKLFAFGLSPFFVSAGGIFEWIKTQAKEKLGFGSDEPKGAEQPNGSGVNGNQMGEPGSAGVVKSSLKTPHSKHDLTALMQKNTQYDGIMAEEYGKLGFTPDEQKILKTQIAAESAFNPNAVSPVGASGLAQFMPATANQYGVNRADPRSSIRGQGRYMKDLLKHSGGDWAKALAFYNAGQGSTNADKRYQKVMGFKETNGYVNKILHNAQKMGVTLGDERTTSTPASQPKPIIVPPTKVFGDSIANQYGKIHHIKDNYGKDGATPKQVYEQLQNAIAKGQLNKGDNVVLSTGLSNGMTGNNDIIAEQMALLKQHGVNFDVLGIANNFKDNRQEGIGSNIFLDDLTKRYGGNFLGGFDYNPKDKYKAHPTNEWIKSLKMSAGEKTKKALQSAFSLPTVAQVPTAPKVQTPIGTKDKGNTTVVAQTTIGQNVSDDRLAYAITGGIGQRT